jgi:hypothetical protein
MTDSPTIAVCARCRHCRTRPDPVLFSGADLQTAAILKTSVQWQEQQREHAAEELRRFEAGLPFDYEPHAYAWCAAFTPDLALARKASDGDASALRELMADGHVSVNTVTGAVTPIFALCARMNPEGQCSRFEAMPSEDSST